MMPFITEELWQRLPKRTDKEAPSLHVAEYPEPAAFSSYRDAKLDEYFDYTMDVVKHIRSRRVERKLLQKTRINSERRRAQKFTLTRRS